MIFFLISPLNLFILSISKHTNEIKEGYENSNQKHDVHHSKEIIFLLYEYGIYCILSVQ